MSRAVIIQQAAGDCVLMLELAAGRHAAYGARHGADYWPLVGNVQFERAPHWNKIVLVRRALELGFEHVAWIDADALVVRDDEDFRRALDPAGGPLGLALHPADAHTGSPGHWNSGVMLMRNTLQARAFFREVWDGGPMGTHGWHEQARMHEVIPRHPGLVQRLHDRWNSTATVTEVPDAIIKAWHGAGTGALTSIYGELKKLGGIDARAAAVADRFIHVDNCVERVARFIPTIPPSPGGWRGRGIVLCGGGRCYFTNAWVCIHQLRRLGCSLPIELWYLGRREMDPAMCALLAPLGVDCIDAHEVRRHQPARILKGWELKPYALRHSRFQEVMLIDADNLAVQNPEGLFESAPFREKGAIFWPDEERMKPTRSAWTVFDVPFRDEPEFESGQILLDKARCWRALSLTMWYNEHSDFFYHHVWGDRDTFRFAWHKLGQTFAMTPFPMRRLQDTMCQHDFAGRRLFQHRNGDKWSLRRENRRIPGFLFEEECRSDLSRLAGLWEGRVQPEEMAAA